MNYSQSFELLNRRFNQSDQEIAIKEAGIVIRNFSFHSALPLTRPSDSSGSTTGKDLLFALSDDRIEVNNDFRYSVFLKEGDTKKHKRVILMLHGLNERKWSKYLPWAVSLVVSTGIPVVLFPISFHMNRAPEAWSDPRILSPLVHQNVETGRLDDNTTIINFALSKRLKDVPERFFLSGYQSITDVMGLVKSWKADEHPLFHSELEVDFFSYSIGAFLTEVLMIANPDQLLDKSRFFFFCGGSLFSGMNPTSRFILNRQAYERINDFYTNEFETETILRGEYQELLNGSAYGKAFRAMLVPHRFQSERDKTFEVFKRRIKAIGLTRDTVVPPGSISEALSGIKDTAFEEMDFEFPYSHENPFDAKLTKFGPLIDDGFNRVMKKAREFLLSDN